MFQALEKKNHKKHIKLPYTQRISYVIVLIISIFLFNFIQDITFIYEIKTPKVRNHHKFHKYFLKPI